MDLFYKLKYLKQAGIRIYLHCFFRNRTEQPLLREYCETVYYYKRNLSWSPFLPYIVSSRKSPELLDRISRDDYPILLEGIHCTYHLYRGRFRGRRVVLRAHNAEFRYYRQLSRNAPFPLHRIYYFLESFLLRRYEARVSRLPDHIGFVSEQEMSLYRDLFGATRVCYIPVIWDRESPSTLPREGFCLYHGNLSVPENEQAVRWLIREVFLDLGVPLVVAGKNPGDSLRKLVRANPQITLLADPQASELKQWIARASINVLPSFSSTGIKLKLLHALYYGGYCLVNPAMAGGTPLAPFCRFFEDASQCRQLILALREQPVSSAELEQRRAFLDHHYDNDRSAREWIRLFWD